MKVQANAQAHDVGSAEVELDDAREQTAATTPITFVAEQAPRRSLTEGGSAAPVLTVGLRRPEARTGVSSVDVAKVGRAFLHGRTWKSAEPTYTSMVTKRDVTADALRSAALQIASSPEALAYYAKLGIPDAAIPQVIAMYAARLTVIFEARRGMSGGFEMPTAEGALLADGQEHVYGSSGAGFVARAQRNAEQAVVTHLVASGVSQSAAEEAAHTIVVTAARDVAKASQGWQNELSAVQALQAEAAEKPTDESAIVAKSQPKQREGLAFAVLDTLTPGEDLARQRRLAEIEANATDDRRKAADRHASGAARAAAHPDAAQGAVRVEDLA